LLWAAPTEPNIISLIFYKRQTNMESE
jgi:hypothetical protein